MGVPIQAADFDVYGKIGMAGWWMKSERFYHDTVGHDPVTNEVIYGKDTIPMNTNIINPIGTLGFKLKGDRFGSCIELGTKPNSYDSHMYGEAASLRNFRKYANFAYLKRWYIEWYIADFMTVLAGQTEAPTCFFPSNQGFNGGTGLNNVGCLCTDAYPMLQISLHHPENIIVGKLAVIKPDTSVVEYLNTSGKEIYYHCETFLPKFEGGFSANIEGDFFAFNGQVAGGYLAYRSSAFKEGIDAKDATLDISSWVIGGDFGVKVGPVKVAFDIFYGMNIGTYGVWVGDAFGWWRISDFMLPFYPKDGPVYKDSAGIPIFVGDTLYNGRALEMAAVVNVKPLDFLYFETGGGTVVGHHDYEPYEKRWTPTYAWYFQVGLTVFDHLKMPFEVGQYWYGPNRGFGRYTYWGFNTLIEF
jgi:hypothetical protein